MSGHIVYLHGFASGPGSKKAAFFSRRFSELGFRVDVPDLAAGNFDALTITSQLQVIEQTAGDGPVTLIGSSLGGYLAALFAARHSSVERIVLMAPGFGFARRWPQRLGAFTMAEWERTGWMQVFHYGHRTEQRVSYNLIRDGVQYEDYPDVKQPCLIFHGRGDTVVPAEWSVEFANDRPNVELHLVDSDHELLNVLEPMWLRMREFIPL